MTDTPTTATAVLCKACRFYNPNNTIPHSEHMCQRWTYGYNEHPLKSTSDIIVENDCGWGADMGPDFGCVLGELR